ncbi:hypothetical protein [Roseivivax isoporae]|uniref:Uncharacterized protein n=1 Tax=Roseivivax isoporae LMG 25204 TaxID=1449351 RepID=X7F3L1_9RHOB|nr:hypothetical protein [Roseivivax isoporae]ETX26686.1 hypothetical protein RISW2_20640 [Roseivivax isoporae LMG 25204]
MTRIDDTKLLELHRSGLSSGEVAKRIGCCRQTVCNRLDALGEPRFRRGCGISRAADIDRQELRRLRDEGVTRATMAGHFRCSQRVVAVALERLERADRRAAEKGAATPPPPGLGNIPAARVAALVETGGRYRELAALAERWGESTTRVQSWYHRARAAA